MKTLKISLGLLAALAGGWTMARPAKAQDSSQVGEVIVTAERRETMRGAIPIGGGQPHVVLFKRADNLIVAAQVDCDTRDELNRLAEMKATLHNMISAAAASGQIELGVENDGVVVPLKPEGLDSLLTGGDKPDTTTTTIVVKTHVGATDTLDGATARIDHFIQTTKVVGRTLVARTGDWRLTLITPRQYRPQIVAAIAQDANDTLKAFGGGYGVQVEGLEHAVQWSRSGPLDLALYIPYALKIEPLPSGR
jgi:hypothetical protein